MSKSFFRMNPFENDQIKLKGLLWLIVAILYFSGIISVLAINVAINNNPSKLVSIIYNAVMNLTLAILIHKRKNAGRIMMFIVQVIAIAIALVNIISYQLFSVILKVEENFMLKQVLFIIKGILLILYFAKSKYVRKYFELEKNTSDETVKDDEKN